MQFPFRKATACPYVFSHENLAVMLFLKHTGFIVQLWYRCIIYILQWIAHRCIYFHGKYIIITFLKQYNYYRSGEDNDRDKLSFNLLSLLHCKHSLLAKVAGFSCTDKFTDPLLFFSQKIFNNTHNL